VEPAVLTLILQAWQARYRQPQTLSAAAEAVLQAAGDDGAAAGWGHLLLAMGHRGAGQATHSAVALGQAQRLLTAAEQSLAVQACRVLRGLALLPQGRALQALELMGEQPVPAAADALQAYTGQFVLESRGLALNGAGRWDAALRERYAALQRARATGDDGATAHALAILASQQSDLNNTEDALHLATEALHHAERAGRTAAWFVAAMNQLGALLSLEQGEEALLAAQTLLPHLDEVQPRSRELACILLARAFARARQFMLAQNLLDRSERERQAGHVLEWTTAQAELWLAQGQALRAQALCERWLEQQGTEAGLQARAPGPDELLLLHRVTALAFEATGELAATLEHERAYQIHYAELAGRNARVRRLTLEIEHELQRERWQRQQAEAERSRLDTLNRALQAASEAKTRFLAAASQDLRQPVQVLATNMAAQEHENVSSAQALLVQQMSRSLSALGRMFDALLDISRLDAGIVQPRARPVALRPLLQRLVDELASSAQAKGLKLRLRLPGGSDRAALMAHTDPELLERGLRHLLDNAINATQEGGVLLALRQPHDSTEEWRLQVLDTGTGIAAEAQAQAFDDFYLVSKPQRDRSQGPGLSLFIVQRLAKLMAHPLSLRSRPGRGSAFSLLLPRAPEAELPAPEPADEPAEGAALCIALVDDDAEVRASLVAQLQRWGHQVLAAGNDMALLQEWHLAGSPVVQALIVDLRLRGGRTGLQAVRALCESWDVDVPALVITADAAPERLSALKDSKLPWLPKPVVPMRLRSWLAGVAQASSAISG
jgi:signal transduction histidine kinase/CheY-like chemotaxis protein